MPKMTTCLWFDTEAEQAARFYCDVFKKSKMLETAYYGPGMPKPEGSVLTVRFQINSQEFLALNAGLGDQFNPSISIMVPCKTQKEIDTLQGCSTRPFAYLENWNSPGGLTNVARITT